MRRLRVAFLKVTARGVPKEAQPASSEGLSVSRRYFTFDGETPDLSKLRQNQRLIVSIEGRNLDGAYHEVALLDLLPAGFEIEAVVNDETAKSFPFLGELTATRVSEGRDDRFFAAFNLGTRTYRTWWDSELRNPNRFNVAYIVRAVTPGSFALPAVNVSDMYAPRIHARSAMGRVYLAEHQQLFRRAALKLLARNLASNPETVKKFLAEARAVEIGRAHV